MASSPPIRISFGLVNAYLLRGEQGDVLVDTGLPGTAPLLLGALRRAGSDPAKLGLIILTHVHLDHVGNLAWLRRVTKAPVLVHRQEAQTLESGQVLIPAGQNPLAKALVGLGRPFAALMRSPRCTAEIVMDGDELCLRQFGVGGRILQTPGHTQGSISVTLETGDAIVGDLCQNGWGYGMGMGPVHLPLADQPNAVAASWTKLVNSGVRRLHPGHGKPFDVDALKAALEQTDSI